MRLACGYWIHFEGLLEAPERPEFLLRPGPIHSHRIYLNDPGTLPDNQKVGNGTDPVID